MYKALRSQLTGGLSIVFSRLAIAGETKIRPHQIKDPETCRKCLGVDANALYLFAIQQENPTGYFVRYKESENFKPDPCSKYGLAAYQWLSWISDKENKFIQRKFNKGEKRLTDQSIPIDSFIEETNEVLQFDGCFFHSCDLCSINRNADGSLEEFHPSNGKRHEDIRKATLENTKKLRDAGYSVRRIQGCEWYKMKKDPQIAAYIKTLKAVQPRYQLNYQKIVERIQDGSLYGFLFVDIETPDHLKEKLADFPPIIKNTDVSRADIGPYMAKIAQEHGYLKKPQRYLISSYFGKNILINSEMAKFYLDLGLKITRIYKFVQFYPSKCFEALALQIAQDRRTADSDSSKTVLAMTSKLIGNSLYSASLLNKHAHHEVMYHDDSTINDVINSPYFNHLDVISENFYEVKCLKKHVLNDLPIQIGLNVYMNAKLHMLKFYYLFIKKYIPDRHIEIVESDTNSVYCTISRDSFDECVPEELKRAYFIEKRNWVPTEVCDRHLNEYAQTKVSGDLWNPPPCCLEYFAFQKRVGGKFKLEWEGEKIVALTCKSYLASGPQVKQVSKGVSIKQNPLTFDHYLRVLETNQPHYISNQGFQTRNHNVFSYKQEKRGLSSFYCKRKVLSDYVHTAPLDICIVSSIVVQCFILFLYSSFEYFSLFCACSFFNNRKHSFPYADITRFFC